MLQDHLPKLPGTGRVILLESQATVRMPLAYSGKMEIELSGLFLLKWATTAILKG